MDSKGRVALPTRYRELVHDRCAGRMVVTIDTEERCLLVYPLSDWEEIERKIEALPSFNKESRRVQRLLIGHATDVELDSGDRLLIPPPLRQYAELDKKVVLIGQGKKLEIWSEQTWEEKRERWIQEDSNGAEMPADLLSISL
jgi:MraZ protein